MRLLNQVIRQWQELGQLAFSWYPLNLPQDAIDSLMLVAVAGGIIATGAVTDRGTVKVVEGRPGTAKDYVKIGVFFTLFPIYILFLIWLVQTLGFGDWGSYRSGVLGPILALVWCVFLVGALAPRAGVLSLVTAVTLVAINEAYRFFI